MNGEVIYFDAERGVGFIAGRDGNRYVFDRADIIGADRLAKGAAVDFSVDEDRARAVKPLVQRGSRVLERPAPAPSAAGSVPSVAGSLGEVADAVAHDDIQEAGETPGIFGFFRRCITANYANFRGRARRKEFWSFALVSMVVILALTGIGFAIDVASGNLTSREVGDQTNLSGAPVATMLLGGLVWLALIIPSVAVTVRRIHDIGLSGWFFLLNFIPSVGGLIVFVFTLIPSQRHPNKWGPVPAGVRL
jgi:uncharacterized membrane protein YhaH (DUF805 family)/cold shock CspA family protein